MKIYTQESTLLRSLSEILSEHRCAFGQERTFSRCTWVVLGLIFAFGRKTLSQVITSLGAQNEDCNSFYRLFSRSRFSYEKLTDCLLRVAIKLVTCPDLVVVAVDATAVFRSSLKMPGTFWGKGRGTPKFRPGIARQQRFSHMSLLSRLEDGFSRAFPLRMLLCPPVKAVPSDRSPCTEWEAGVQQMQWLRSRVDRLLLFLFDGNYDVNALIAKIPESCICLIRCARNRKLFTLATPPKQRRRGRPSSYGEQAPKPSSFFKERKGWQFGKVRVRGRTRDVRYRVEGPYLVEGAPKTPVFLIVVGGYDRVIDGKRKKADPRSYLVNAAWLKGGWVVPLPVLDLLTWAYQRWEIEVCHRELKTSFGMGQMQCWSKRASTLSVQWMAWAYSVLMLAGYQAWEGQLAGPARPSSSWWPGSRRWSFNNLWQGYRLELWRPPDLLPVCMRTPFKPEKITSAWPPTLVNTVVRSVRG